MGKDRRRFLVYVNDNFVDQQISKLVNIVPNVFDRHVCLLHLVLPISCTNLCCQQPRIKPVLSQVYDILIAGVNCYACLPIQLR
jgi:hypothetical protein